MSSGGFTISTLSSMQFVIVNVYNILDGISVQKDLWPKNNLIFSGVLL